MAIEYRGIVPYLFYDDAGAAMDWYARVFDFEDRGRWQDDSGAVQRDARVLAAGVDVEPPVTREFGVRMLSVPDPFGYTWRFMCRVQAP